MKNRLKAREAVIAYCSNKKGVSGTINPCPVCGKGPLSYSRANNGHVWAICKTECVKWME